MMSGRSSELEDAHQRELMDAHQRLQSVLANIARDHKRIYTNLECENFKVQNGIFGLDDCALGEERKHPFGERQMLMDNRFGQMVGGTPLKYYKWRGPRSTRDTTKRFIITDIRKGGWPRFESRFNDYIITLKRIS